MTAKLSSSAHIQERQRLGQWLPWVVLIASLIATYLMWNNEQQNSIKGLQAEFDFHVRDTDSRIEQRMKAYEQILHGTQSAFFTFNSMGRSEFHAYVSNLNLEKDYPGISGVAFVLVVPAAQKAKHIASIRKEGFPEYMIFPDGVREIYTPVIYFEPFSGRNLKAFGHDPYSDPGRRATMESARDSADAAITSKIKLVQESGKDIQAGVIMHMPVYKFGVPHDTLSQRRANILGWVSAVFRMNDLMRGILGERSADLAIEIYDGEEISEQALMYESGNNRHTDAKPHSRFQSIQHMEIAGHPWTMVLSSLPDFDAKLDKGKSRLIGYAGIGTAILLALFTWLLVRGRAQALQAAREVSRELTERKRLENELRHALKQQHAREEELRVAHQQAEEATRAKSRFLAAAGHDLRQPLAAANMFIGTLKFTKPNSNQSEIIGRIEGTMSNFNGLLNALLNISKLESGAIEPEYKPVAVTDIALWLKQSFAPMAEERGLVLKLRFPTKNLVVLSDFNLIKQVLGNLVANAIKYTPQGTILVSARPRGASVLLQVWDTGIGIEADQFERIFEGFYQINNPQGDSENGLGLGLAIVKRSLTLLGVEINCRSQFGRGSVFEFSLPLDDTGQTPQPASISAHDEMGDVTFARGRRFVVLENDRLVAQAISGLLQAMGGEVQLFSSAEDALRNPDTESADYYICDYSLDGELNGLQFLSQLRQKLGCPIKAILMSGDTSTTFIREIKGCDWPVLSKPVNISSLIFRLAGMREA